MEVTKQKKESRTEIIKIYLALQTCLPQLGFLHLFLLHSHHILNIHNRENIYVLNFIDWQCGGVSHSSIDVERTLVLTDYTIRPSSLRERQFIGLTLTDRKHIL